MRAAVLSALLCAVPASGHGNEPPAASAVVEPTGESAVEALAAALIAEGDEAGRSRLLERSHDLVTAALVRALVAHGEEMVDRGEYERALRAFATAEAVATSIGDRGGVARALNGKGFLHCERMDLDAAIADHQRALALGEAASDRAAMARANWGIGVIDRLRGDYDRSQLHHERSLALWRAVGDREGIAIAHKNLGNAWGGRHMYARALEYYRTAFAAFEELGDAEAVAGVRNNIATIYSSVGSYRDALTELRAALAVQEQAGNRRLIAMLHINLGWAQLGLGDHALALESYLRALRILEDLGNTRDLGRALNNIGMVHLAQGSYDLAGDYFERGLEAHRQLGEKDPIAEALWNLATTREAQGRYAQALDYARSSLELYQSIGATAGVATVERTLGRIHRRLGSVEEAREHYRRSLDLYSALGQRQGVAEATTDLASLALFDGDNEEALRLATAAAEASRAMGTRETLWRAAMLVGGAERALGRPRQARRALEESVSVIESLRHTAARGEEDRQGFFEQKMEAYHALVSLLVAEGDGETALATVERTKARALLDLLDHGETRVVGALTAGEAAAEQRLVDRLALLNGEQRATMVENAVVETRKARIESDLERARRDLAAFRSEIYAAHPELAVSRGELESVGLRQAADLLRDPSRALLSYLVTADRTYLFVLTRAAAVAEPSLSVHTIALPRAELDRWTEGLRSRLAQLDARFAPDARAIYDLLVRPARAELLGKTSIVIIPDGALWELPFQALQPAAGRYLVEDTAISYAPSLTVLRAMERRRAPPSRGTSSSPTLLAFGNPDIGVETRQRSERVLLGATLEPLPEAERQVNALAALYGEGNARAYVGAQAREERVKAEASNYRILQFATHGVLNDASPMYSHLVLARPTDEHEDGLLEAWEMMDLDLDADLVVLAACETARGPVPAGEGVVGMSWTLFAAGASTTVVSQWKVESASTTELMLAFHRAIQNQRATDTRPASAGVAMREAALQVLHDPRYRHPFYWAGFVVIGAS